MQVERISADITLKHKPRTGTQAYNMLIESLKAEIQEKQEILSHLSQDKVKQKFMGCSLFADIEFAKEILKAAQTAKKIGAKVSFDPNIRKELIGEKETDKILENLMRLTNVFLPGEEELLLLTGKETVEEAVEECFKNPELEILALKQGSRGSKIYTKEKTVETGIYRIQPVDATGAGDSFDAAFICGLCEGKRIEEAAKMAAAAGAINTAAFGPMEGKISVEAIDKMIKEE